MVAEPIRIGQIWNWGQGERIYSVKWKSVSLSANWGGGWAKTWLYAVPNLISVGGEKDKNKTSNQAMIHRSKWVRWNQLGLP
jgi:hypothetical protein